MEKKHQDVLPLLQRNPSKLNVAFSSYSFEEWILLHFEQNDTVFICSDCSDEKDNSFMCGTHPLGYNGHDCHGNLCIAGYLRERNYISNYTKGDKHIFFQYTLKNGRVRQEALYNAAWIRSRSRRFSEQPYTDVDELVCRMTGTKERVIWRRLGETFLFGATELNIIRTTKTLLIENTGDKTCLLKYGNITTTDNPLQKGDSVCTNSAEVLPEGECKEIPFSSEKKYLRIADGDNTVIIEL